MGILKAPEYGASGKGEGGGARRQRAEHARCGLGLDTRIFVALHTVEEMRKT